MHHHGCGETGRCSLLLPHLLVKHTSTRPIFLVVGVLGQPHPLLRLWKHPFRSTHLELSGPVATTRTRFSSVPRFFFPPSCHQFTVTKKEGGGAGSNDGRGRAIIRLGRIGHHYGLCMAQCVRRKNTNNVFYFVHHGGIQQKLHPWGRIWRSTRRPMRRGKKKGIISYVLPHLDGWGQQQQAHSS
jgi:hypothetical protein